MPELQRRLEGTSRNWEELTGVGSCDRRSLDLTDVGR